MIHDKRHLKKPTAAGKGVIVELSLPESIAGRLFLDPGALDRTNAQLAALGQPPGTIESVTVIKKASRHVKKKD
jgi:hypothetical protein